MRTHGAYAREDAEDRERAVSVPGVVAQGFGDLGPAVATPDADSEVADGGHRSCD
jgi:hypothetical protein